ncbi:hypothetical protein SAY87_027663 [Trapa incisa]|uniref:C2H2-type domain-containing protein n=1 Tax=Trapa incisa TaxID=236973 RepID=A0AAN7PKK1_9MYRT|nr:hypothetical protein SAY87_027663 [Trapa incisa]
MKRSVPETEFLLSVTVAKCLMSASCYPGSDPAIGDSSHGRVFECKTCSRRFSSFQALGGHRASHKKPRSSRTPEDHGSAGSHIKRKTHECSVCGLEFAVGQALGGHMRRHRVSMPNVGHHWGIETAVVTALGFHTPPPSTIGEASPDVKKADSRRILRLDLNLTPLENDLGLRFGKAAPPIVDCFI